MTLFPVARWTDPSTSHDAAARMKPAAPALEAQILEVLAFRALTDDSICIALGIDPRRWPSVKTCRSRLSKQGKVVWTGDVLNRQRVWARPENVQPLRVVVQGDEL